MGRGAKPKQGDPLPLEQSLTEKGEGRVKLAGALKKRAKAEAEPTQTFEIVPVTKPKGLRRAKKDVDSDDDLGDIIPISTGQDEDDVDAEPIPLSELPTISGVGKSAGKKKVQKDSRTVYIGRLPFGFFEEQLYGFFSQFGAIKHLKLSRNKLTGRSKHYCFIEFTDAATAKIVAETMHNYMMFDRLLQCHLVPLNKCHKLMFKGGRRFKKVPWNEIARQTHNRVRTESEHEKQVERLLRSEQKRREKLAAAGIDYDWPGFQAEVDEKAGKKKRKATASAVDVPSAKKVKKVRKAESEETPKKAKKSKVVSTVENGVEETPLKKKKRALKVAAAPMEGEMQVTPKKKTKKSLKAAAAGEEQPSLKKKVKKTVASAGGAIVDTATPVKVLKKKKAIANADPATPTGKVKKKSKKIAS